MPKLCCSAPGSSPQVLTTAFDSACDPNVHFDGTRLLFTGKKTANDAWNIYEIRSTGRDYVRSRATWRLS